MNYNPVIKLKMVYKKIDVNALLDIEKVEILRNVKW